MFVRWHKGTRLNQSQDSKLHNPNKPAPQRRAPLAPIYIHTHQTPTLSLAPAFRKFKPGDRDTTRLVSAHAQPTYHYPPSRAPALAQICPPIAMPKQKKTHASCLPLSFFVFSPPIPTSMPDGVRQTPGRPRSDPASRRRLGRHQSMGRELDASVPCGGLWADAPHALGERCAAGDGVEACALRREGHTGGERVRGIYGRGLSAAWRVHACVRAYTGGRAGDFTGGRLMSGYLGTSTRTTTTTTITQSAYDTQPDNPTPPSIPRPSRPATCDCAANRVLLGFTHLHPPTYRPVYRPACRCHVLC